MNIQSHKKFSSSLSSKKIQKQQTEKGLINRKVYFHNRSCSGKEKRKENKSPKTNGIHLSLLNYLSSQHQGENKNKKPSKMMNKHIQLRRKIIQEKGSNPIFQQTGPRIIYHRQNPNKQIQVAQHLCSMKSLHLTTTTSARTFATEKTKQSMVISAGQKKSQNKNNAIPSYQFSSPQGQLYSSISLENRQRIHTQFNTLSNLNTNNILTQNLPKKPLILRKQISIETFHQARVVHTIVSQNHEELSEDTNDFLMKESIIDEDFQNKIKD